MQNRRCHPKRMWYAFWNVFAFAVCHQRMPWRGHSRKTIGVWLPYDVSVSEFICANILIFNGIAMLLSLNLMGNSLLFLRLNKA